LSLTASLIAFQSAKDGAFNTGWQSGEPESEYFKVGGVLRMSSSAFATNASNCTFRLEILSDSVRSASSSRLASASART
jgi:hypothetical protein